MPRPDRSPDRRRALLPILSRAFADLSYRRATTAALAERCGVQEPALYRLWPDKKAMFVAAIGHVFESAEAVWSRLASEGTPGASTAELVLRYEAVHHGEHGLHRLIHAGLSETDDPEIRAALKHMYGRFQRFVRRAIEDHHTREGSIAPQDAHQRAWAIVGLGTVAGIARELSLLGPRARADLFEHLGGEIIRSAAPVPRGRRASSRRSPPRKGRQS